MSLDDYTVDNLTHGIFKIQILGLITRYQEIIEDPATEKSDLKWLNEELEQLSLWLKDINTMDSMLDFSKIKTNLDQSSKLISFYQLEFETKSKAIDETFQTKENQITQTFNDLVILIDTDFQAKKDDIDQTFSQLENFKGDKGDKGDKGEKGDQGIQGIEGEKGDQGEKGQDGKMSFEDLTLEQKESLKGDKGIQGDKGEKGENGIDGDPGIDGKTPTFSVVGSVLTIEI